MKLKIVIISATKKIQSARPAIAKYFSIAILQHFFSQVINHE